MNKYYFNADESAEFPKSYETLRVVEHGGGFQVLLGGYRNDKGKVMQASVIAYCDTKEEADKLVGKLCEITD